MRDGTPRDMRCVFLLLSLGFAAMGCKSSPAIDTSPSAVPASTSSAATASPLATVSPSAAAGEASPACNDPKLRARYASDKEMQLTRDDFATWCKRYLERQRAKADLDDRIRRAATAPAAELCAWPIDMVGGPIYYVAVRADRLVDHDQTTLPEPLQSYLRMERFERYAGNSGVQGYVDKRSREVPDVAQEFGLLSRSARILGLDAHTHWSKTLAGRADFTRDDWAKHDAAFEEATKTTPLSSYFAKHCEELVTQIDAVP